MKINRRLMLGSLAGIAAASLSGLSAPVRAADQITLNVLYNLPGFTKFHQPLADEFMKNNPDI